MARTNEPEYGDNVQRDISKQSDCLYNITVHSVHCMYETREQSVSDLMITEQSTTMPIEIILSLQG